MKYFFTCLLFLLSSFVTSFFVFTRKVKVSLLCCLLLSSCVTPITLHKKSLSDSVSRPAKKVEKTVSSFLFGFVNSSKKIKAWEKCPQTWQSIRITRPFLHIFMAGLTLGIYTPFKVIITCSAKTKSDPKLDDFEQFNIEEE